MATSSSSITTSLQAEIASSAAVFVSCIKGLESHLCRELKALDIPYAKAACAGAFIPEATLEQAMRICYGSRLALRVLWQLHTFRLWKPQNLYQQIVKQPWQPWLMPQLLETASMRSLKIGVSGHNRHFSNTHFAIQRTKDAICDHLRERCGKRPVIDKEDADIRLQLHLEPERATLYFDLSAAPLNQRGYREETGPAPLNEVVAASLLALAGYDGYRPFCDPCCGSGTLLVEAAMIATRTPPGRLRQQFGFQIHPLFDQDRWQQVRERLDAQQLPLSEGRLLGIDADPAAIAQTRQALALYGFPAQLITERFQKASVEGSYFVLTNPPFGHRLKPAQLIQLYSDLGHFFQKHASRAFAFSSSSELLQAIGLPVLQSFTLAFGGQECLLQRFKASAAASPLSP